MTGASPMAIVDSNRELGYPHGHDLARCWLQKITFLHIRLSALSWIRKYILVARVRIWTMRSAVLVACGLYVIVPCCICSTYWLKATNWTWICAVDRDVLPHLRQNCRNTHSSHFLRPSVRAFAITYPDNILHNNRSVFHFNNRGSDEIWFMVRMRNE